MQYTIRNIPKDVDAALRRRARHTGKTLNDVTVEALAEGLGLTRPARVRQRSMSDVAGALPRDPEMEVALEEQRVIDEELWR